MTSQESRGVPQQLKGVIDKLLVRGTPKEVVNEIFNDTIYPELQQYVRDITREELYKRVANRKKSLNRLAKGPLVMETVADLMNWAAAHLFPDSIPAFDSRDQELLYVLPQGYRSDIRVVVFSSAAVAANILRAHTDRPDGFSLMIDGTWKLHHGEWVLLTCGVISIDWKRHTSGLSQTFRPVAYCFAESENIEAVVLLLSSLKAFTFK